MNGTEKRDGKEWRVGREEVEEIVQRKQRELIQKEDKRRNKYRRWVREK